MKLAAISNRGSRRDFVDLYVAGQAFGVEAIGDWFDRKYATVSYNRSHVLKALTYFADAEEESMPARDRRPVRGRLDAANRPYP
jgi:hypothetical protein